MRARARALSHFSTVGFVCARERERDLTQHLFKQDKTPSTILKELGSGKLFDKGSILWKSVSDPEEEAVITQRDGLAAIRQLKQDLKCKNE